MLTAGLLQQDIMRSALEAKPNQQFEVLNQLLGLDSLERFEEAAKDWLKSANQALATAREDEARIRQQRQQAEGRLATTEAEAAARPTVEAAQAELQASLGRYSSVPVRGV